MPVKLNYLSSVKDPVTNLPSCYYRLVCDGLISPNPTETSTTKLVDPIYISGVNFPQDTPTRFVLSLPGTPDYAGHFAGTRAWTVKRLRGAAWQTLTIVPYDTTLATNQCKIFNSSITENSAVIEVHNGTLTAGDYLYFDGYFISCVLHAEDIFYNARRVVYKNSSAVESTKTIRTKIIEIGDWNMDTTSSLDVAANEMDRTKVRSISAIIKNDGNTHYSDMNAGGYLYIYLFSGITQVRLERTTSGIFDDVTYTSTSYNRGWVFIEYEIS